MTGAIRGRIIISHWLVVLLVLLILGPTAYWLMVSTLKKQSFQQLSFLATHMAGMVDTRMQWFSQQLADLARDPLIRSFPETARIPAVSDLFIRRKQLFPVMAYLDAEGWEEVRVVKGVQQADIGPFANKELFEQAKDHANSLLSQHPRLSPWAGEPVVPVVYGIRRYFGDEFVGALYAELRLDKLTRFLGTIPVGRTGFLLLFDRQRRLLYHPDRQMIFRHLTPSDKDSSWIQEAFKDKSGVAEGSVMGLEALVGYAPVKSLDAVLVAVLPLDEFFDAPNRMKKTIAFAVVLLLGVAAFIARWYAARLTRPLLQLTRLAGQVASGVLPEQVDVPKTGDEIDQLAESFKQMVTELRYSMVSRQYLDRILAVMNDALLLVGLDGKIRTANRAACELLALPEEDLTGRQLESLFVVEETTGEPWLQVLLAQPGARQTRQMLKTGDKLRPVRFTWSVLADATGRVREVACLFSPLSETYSEKTDLHQGQE